MQPFLLDSNGEIRIELSETETDVTLSVADNGIGIEYEKQAMIFEKFTQVHNQIFGKPDGSGLGLFITKKLTEAQGGVIYVESELGKGATFYIRLPKASIMHKKEMEA
ncbi:MAG: ATP-binding protein [Bacteroidota bacterium]